MTSLRARALKSFGSMINVSPYKFDEKSGSIRASIKVKCFSCDGK